MDETDNLALTGRRRWGLLRQMMERQAEAKDVISELREEVSERSLLVEGYNDDHLIAMALCIAEVREADGSIQKGDVIRAGEFLDHLDTQGFGLRRKGNRPS